MPGGDCGGSPRESDPTVTSHVVVHRGPSSVGVTAARCLRRRTAAVDLGTPGVAVVDSYNDTGAVGRGIGCSLSQDTDDRIFLRRGVGWHRGIGCKLQVATVVAMPAIVVVGYLLSQDQLVASANQWL